MGLKASGSGDTTLQLTAEQGESGSGLFSRTDEIQKKKKKGREMKENHAQPVIPHSVKIIYQN